MRGTQGHFDVIRLVLSWLAPFKGKIKINTLVSSQNLSVISEIAGLVGSLGVSRWSVYEYWPLAGGRSAVAKHAVRNDEFRAATASLGNRPDLSTTTVEIVPATARRLTYPLVSHEGVLYVHSSEPGRDFEDLGSIFDDANVQHAFALCSGQRPEAHARYVRQGAQ
jgi:hypothetical protein